MPQQGRIVGLDIAKRKVDGCIRSLRLRLSQPSTAEGQAKIIAWLQAHQVTTAIMEASGGYERSWAAALRQTGIAVRILDPKRVRHFAKSAGRLAKNDPIRACPRAGRRPDPWAEMIAWFGETFADVPSQPHDPDREELDALLMARAMLVKMATQIGNHAEHAPPPMVAKAFAAIAASLAGQRARLEAAIAAKLARTKRFAEPAEIIQSIPGLARQAAAGVIAWLPELSRIGGKPAAALVGAAPYDDDSGARQGERHIKGGRREIRDLLYIVTLGCVTRHNPVLKAYYQRLRARGKPFKVALIACLRKLVVILNAMLRRGEKWDASRYAAVAV
jgi:transposase